MTHALLYFACFDTIEAVKIMSKSMQIKKITHYVKKQRTNVKVNVDHQIDLLTCILLTWSLRRVSDRVCDIKLCYDYVNYWYHMFNICILDCLQCYHVVSYYVHFMLLCSLLLPYAESLMM